MNNIEMKNFIQDARDNLKVLFDHYHHSVNIIYERCSLSCTAGEKRLNPMLRNDFVELYDSVVYYHIDSVQYSTELSELLKAEPDYMFNMYLLLPEKLFNTLLYIQYEDEYFKFNTNRIYCIENIHDYIMDII